MNKYGKTISALVVLAFASNTFINVSLANAATKPVAKPTTITCYKATAVKKVTAVAPKCATGWTTKKPVAKPTAKPTATPASTKASSGSTIAFNTTYKGKISTIWSDSDVQATVNATGSGILDTMVGTGSSAPASQCDSVIGNGTLSGPGGTLTIKSDSSGKGCAADGAAPTSVALTGNAVITGGTRTSAGARQTRRTT